MKVSYFQLVVLMGFAFLSSASHAQQTTNGSLKGKLVDSKTKKPVDYVSFAVKNVKDSAVMTMGATTNEGVFLAKAIAFGQYKFYAAIIGYKPIIKAFEITKERPAIDFGILEMEESAITLNDVLIKGDFLPMIIKKDTIEFSASAFKTQADANVEDVLKVMPGMLVDKDGNISFNGKKIDKVLVDGKEFFGSDPKTATQNLPKEIVNKIQVVEKKTDDALFKGIDDGKREQILNITLKDDKKKGYFGNVGLGKASGNLYDSNININRFNGKSQFSAISIANNINKTGFSFSDLSDFLGGDVFGSGMVGSIAIDESGNVSIGFSGDGGVSSSNSSGGGTNDNKAIGFNYNDEWGKIPKFPNKISANYMYSHNYGIRQSLNSRLNLLGVDSYFNDRNNDATTTTNRHRLAMKLDFALDSTMKIQVMPNFGFSGNNSENSALFNSYNQLTQTDINQGNSFNSNKNNAPAFGGRLSFNKRFKKKGRSFSLAANGNSSNSTLDGINLSNITINNNGVPANTILNQIIDQAGNVNGYGFNADYAEPLSKKVQLSINYSFSKREDLIERSVYDYNTTNTRYDILNPILSNNLKNYNSTQGIGLRLNYTASPKFNLSLNSTQQYIALDGDNLTNNRNVATDFVLLNSNFYASYKITKTSNLNLTGSRFGNAPNISQLQPLTDNSNPLFITTGNPLLKPSSQNYFSLNYNRFNPTSGINLNFALTANVAENQIINNSLQDPKTGIQNTFYDNINGNYNFGARLSGGFKIKQLNLSINPSMGVSSSKNNSFLNRAKVDSKSLTYSFGVTLNYALGSELQLYNQFNGSSRTVTYGYGSIAPNTFTSLYNNLGVNVSLPYNYRFALQSNVSYNANLGIGGANNIIHLANISMEKMFFKKNLILKGSVSDVFNNSRNISRLASDTYILESINLGMRRYFLVGLTYRLRKFGSNAPTQTLGNPMVRF